MSDLELTDRYDDVLLSVPWRVKYDSPRDQTYLFKYASHPERTGYIMIMTDLISLHYEILFGPPLPARLRSSKQLVQSIDVEGEDGEEDEDEDPFEAVDKGLSKLAGLFSNATLWEEVNLEVKEDRTYDQVVRLTTDEFAWIFNLTEARGRRPLSLISRHLVSPLTTLIAHKEGFPIPKSRSKEEDPLKQTMDLLASTELQQSLDKITQGGDVHANGLSFSLSTATFTFTAAPKSNSKSKSKDTSNAGAKRRIISDSPSTSPSVSTKEMEDDLLSPSPDDTKTKPKPISKKVATNEPDADLGPDKVEERIPTQMLSQKSKREREQEEEEAVERRMAEMRKKMASGGGGKLGRRRMGR